MKLSYTAWMVRKRKMDPEERGERVRWYRFCSP